MTRVHVAPAGTRDFLRDAVVRGGGVLVDAAAAEALVWTGSDDAAGLRRLLQQHPNIAWVQLPWAGIEPYLSVLDDRHRFTAGQGVYATPVAEHALMLALAGLRGLKAKVAATTWGPRTGLSLVDGRVTIFGAGGVAKELIRMLQPFHVDVTVVRRRPDPLDGARVVSLAQRADAVRGRDVVFLALALTPQTTGIIARDELNAMAPHAWLVNVARGAHVVTADLVDALAARRIGGAALDVTDPEPLPAGHPLWALDNCIITPHVGNTPEMAVPLLSARVEENVRRYGAGLPLLGVVDTALGY